MTRWCWWSRRRPPSCRWRGRARCCAGSTPTRCPPSSAAGRPGRSASPPRPHERADPPLPGGDRHDARRARRLRPHPRARGDLLGRGRVHRRGPGTGHSPPAGHAAVRDDRARVGHAGSDRRVRRADQLPQRALQRGRRRLLLPRGARVDAGLRAAPPPRRGGGGRHARRRSRSPTGRTRTRPRSTRSPRSPSRRWRGSRCSGAGGAGSPVPAGCCWWWCISRASPSAITCSRFSRGRRSSLSSRPRWARSPPPIRGCAGRSGARWRSLPGSGPCSSAPGSAVPRSRHWARSASWVPRCMRLAAGRVCSPSPVS